jgi:hypothetical protein
MRTGTHSPPAKRRPPPVPTPIANVCLKEQSTLKWQEVEGEGVGVKEGWYLC